jgi:hypothetical protein
MNAEYAECLILLEISFAVVRDPVFLTISISQLVYSNAEWHSFSFKCLFLLMEFCL